MNLANYIRDVQDFPVEGILFKDITTLLQDPDALRMTVDKMVAYARTKQADVIVGIESRGFMFGMPMAYQLGCGFIPIRKPGKLPAETIQESYALEYGTNILEVHVDAIQKGQRVIIVDDLLATGGTAQATCKLVRRLGGEIVGTAFAIELSFLKGHEKLDGCDIFSLIKFD